jgi:pimeloyl-ACP methyl ester carboxylesterase
MNTDASLLADDSLESSEPSLASDIESDYRKVNGVQLHVVTAGDPDNPLVVLLHGFPDFWYGWRDQLASLVDAGYRVVVPDQRGYNLSDAPGSLGAYRMSTLSADVCALIDSEGRESAHVVGHDWGAGVAWDLALRHPSVLDRLGIVNGPHPTVFRKTVQSNRRQFVKSRYMLYFQLPRVPEWILARNDGARLATALEESANPGTFDEETLRRYRMSWRHNGVGPMLDWYRAALRRPDEPPRETVPQPTVLCWGAKDKALVSSMARGSIDYCEDGRLKMFPDGSHWVHREREAVTDALLEHLSGE